MSGYIFGTLFIAFAIWRWRRFRPASNGTEIEGTVVEVRDEKSTITGNNSRRYAPRIAYRHPDTGDTEVFESGRFGNHRHERGERISIYLDPDTGEVSLPLDAPIKETVVLVAVGIGFYAAQYFSG